MVRTRDDDTSPKTDSPGSPPRFKGKPRGPAKFREREVARALRIAKRAGGVASVQLTPDGRIQLVLGAPTVAADTELDKWLASKNARQA